MRIWTLALMLVAGLLGAGGVAAAAAAAHLAAPGGMTAIAQIGMTHAAAVCALAALAARLKRPRWTLFAAILQAFGAVLFCSELAVRHFFGVSLFSMAAPTGGSLIILGWLCVSVAAVREAVSAA